MPELAHLLLDGRLHVRMAVTHIEHRYTGHEIDIAFAVDIPYLGTLRPVHDQRVFAAIRGGKAGRIPFYPGPALRPGPIETEIHVILL